MSDAIDIGGPAFPQPCCDTGHAANSPYGIAGGGISIRDYFAAAALTGLMANSDWYSGAANRSHAGEAPLGEQAAARAFNVADAMLAARTKGA